MGRPALDSATEGPIPSQVSPTERARNLASVFGAALDRGVATRGELISATGLSKATVARMVDELMGLGLLSGTPQASEPRGRGRIPTALTVPESLGQVVGVSFGVRRTVVLSSDLAGRELSQRTYETPVRETLAETLTWLIEGIVEARDRTADAPLLRVVVALPARIVGGAQVSHPPRSMARLEGAEFAASLADALHTDVSLDSDANAALAGILAEGLVPESESSVLLNMGTALTVSQRREDGSTAGGRSSAFGNLSLIPFLAPEGDSTLGDMLSRHGLERYCEQRGVPLEDLSQLLLDTSGTSMDALPPGAASILAAFTDAVLAVLRIIAVAVDPGRVVLAGRLVPLVERVLPELVRRLAEELDDPPRLQAIALYGTTHSTAHGAARVALAHVQRALREQLTAGTRPPADT